jgi:hypothetical protein
MCDSSRRALLLYSPSVPREGAHVLGCFEEEISPHETGQRRPKVRPQHHHPIAPHTTRLRLYRPHACANIFLSCAIACVRRAQATGTIDSTTTITNADVPIVTATTPMAPLPQPLLAHGHHEPTQAAPLRAGQIRHIRHRGGDQLVFLVPVSGHVVAVRVSLECRRGQHVRRCLDFARVFRCHNPLCVVANRPCEQIRTQHLGMLIVQCFIDWYGSYVS